MVRFDLVFMRVVLKILHSKLPLPIWKSLIVNGLRMTDRRLISSADKFLFVRLVNLGDESLFIVKIYLSKSLQIPQYNNLNCLPSKRHSNDA